MKRGALLIVRATKRPRVRALLLLLMLVFIIFSLSVTYYFLILKPLVIQIPLIDNFSTNIVVYQPVSALWQVKISNNSSLTGVLIVVVCTKKIIRGYVTGGQNVNLGVVPAGVCVLYLRAKVKGLAYSMGNGFWLVIHRKIKWW